jgi:hypothetical protein
MKYFCDIMNKEWFYQNIMTFKRDCSKNPHCHSERSEESHVFSFQVKKSKNRSFGLRPQDDKERQIYKNFGTVL